MCTAEQLTHFLHQGKERVPATVLLKRMRAVAKECMRRSENTHLDIDFSTFLRVRAVILVRGVFILCASGHVRFSVLAATRQSLFITFRV